jgi:hypothetical protein
MARVSSIYGVDEPCFAVNNMEPLEPSDAMMMPASTPSSERTLIPAMPATESLPPTAGLENLHSNHSRPSFFVPCSASSPRPRRSATPRSNWHKIHFFRPDYFNVSAPFGMRFTQALRFPLLPLRSLSR